MQPKIILFMLMEPLLTPSGPVGGGGGDQGAAVVGGLRER